MANEKNDLDPALSEAEKTEQTAAELEAEAEQSAQAAEAELEEDALNKGDGADQKEESKEEEPDLFEQAELTELATRDASPEDAEKVEKSLKEEQEPVQTGDTPENSKSYEKMLKKQEKDSIRAAKKTAHDEEKAKAEKKEEKTETGNSTEAKAPAANAAVAPKAAPRGMYARVLTTGQYIGAFVIMLIPGINILAAIIWALGGAKNPNKVNFTRGFIVYFLIEVVLIALIGGSMYIYANQNQTKYLKKMDNYTNGLLSYFNVRSFKDLDRVRNVSDYLVPKDSHGNPQVVKVRATRVVENPKEIQSYEDFKRMYSGYKPGSITRAKLGKKTQSQDGYYTGEKFRGTAHNMVQFMQKYHIDSTSPGLVYIIIDNNGTENCVIAFDPTGQIQQVPTVQMNNKTIYVGGVH